MIQTGRYSVLAAAKPFHQFGIVCKGHQSYLILRPESVERFERSVPDLLAEGIETTASVDEQNH